MNTIHSCGYHCDKPGCIKEQRDYLVNKFIVNARKPLTTNEVEKIINDNTDSDGICCADDLLVAIKARG